MGTNERRPDRLEKRARDVVTAKAAREAKRVGGAAIAAECPWLRFYCPACRRIGEVDLRKLDRHRGATVESLLPVLSCRRRSPNPPFATLLGLSTLTT
jgi:hypothetical protein